VHRYHLTWSRDGTWERIAQRLAEAVRAAEGRDPEASVGLVDASSVKGAATVTGETRAFLTHCRTRGVAAEVVNRIHASRFVPLPRRWIVERTWAWLSMNRRLQIDHERDPAVTEDFIWTAHSRLLLRRLTT
jgi:transposase